MRVELPALLAVVCLPPVLRGTRACPDFPTSVMQGDCCSQESVGASQTRLLARLLTMAASWGRTHGLSGLLTCFCEVLSVPHIRCFLTEELRGSSLLFLYQPLL